MNEHAQEPQAKKIIIDEGWKAQVEAEKEAAKQQPPPQARPDAQQRPKGPLPPPSLTLLATSLGMQAMIALGLVAVPGEEKPQADLEEAQHVIGILDMLRQKTEGNRTPDETATLDGLLHELRLGYIAVQGQKPAS